jgi:hypothetical protein
VDERRGELKAALLRVAEPEKSHAGIAVRDAGADFRAEIPDAYRHEQGAFHGGLRTVPGVSAKPAFATGLGEAEHAGPIRHDEPRDGSGAAGVLNASSPHAVGLGDEFPHELP